jgi:hypothetical protein
MACLRRFKLLLGAEVTERPALGVPTALKDGLELPEFMPSSPPRIGFFAASHLFFGSGIKSSVIVVDLAFLSCW